MENSKVISFSVGSEKVGWTFNTGKYKIWVGESVTLASSGDNFSEIRAGPGQSNKKKQKRVNASSFVIKEAKSEATDE